MNCRRFVFTIVFLTLSLTIPMSLAAPTLARQDAVPSASPETGNRTEFALTPVGDHPDGFFNDLQVLPGGSVHLSVMVHNLGTVPVTLDAYVTNAINTVNGGFTAAPPSDEPFEATSWVEWPEQTIELAPGEQMEIPFSVHVPADAAPGQHITALVVETAEALSIPGTNSLDYTLSSSISLGILVPGQLNHEFVLGEPQVVAASNGYMLDIPVINTGNYLVRPSGELIVTNNAGEKILTSSLQMGSVYSGLSTTLQIALPEQMPTGEYVVSLDLVDRVSGSTASVDKAAIKVPEPIDSKGVSVAEASVVSNAEDIVFAHVDVTLNNGGQQLSAANVTLEVMRDGELVDSFPLATNQVLLSGENQFVTRYLPADMWQSGEYTFSVTVSAVDPNGGQETILLDEELDAAIVVP